MVNKGRTKLATSTATLKIGPTAPAFSLPPHDRRTISPAELRGSRVVLAFFAFAFTGT